MTYAEKLQDPRWKKKRLSILDRDGSRCVVCGSRVSLQIHHCYYVSQRMPWEYPNDSLVTVCDDCHKNNCSPRGKFYNWERAACAVLRATRRLIQEVRGQ